MRDTGRAHRNGVKVRGKVGADLAVEIEMIVEAATEGEAVAPLRIRFVWYRPEVERRARATGRLR